DPLEITETLGIEPQHTWTAGTQRRDRAGAALAGVHRDSYWRGRLMDHPQRSSAGVSVESVLVQRLAHFRRSYGFLERLQAEAGDAQLHVSLYTRDAFRLELSEESLGL